MILYRGIVRQSPDEPILTRSTISVCELAGNHSVNPHDQLYANKLLWVSNSQKLAEAISISRLATRIAFDPDFEARVLMGEVRPTIIKFATGYIHPELYHVVGPYLEKARKPGFQMIAQDLSGSTISQMEPTRESIETMHRELSDPNSFTSGIGEKALNSLQQNYGYVGMEKSAFSFVDYIRNFIDRYNRIRDDQIDLPDIQEDQEAAMNQVAKDIHLRIYYGRNILRFDREVAAAEGQFARSKEAF
jgi:hypothetical protein